MYPFATLVPNLKFVGSARRAGRVAKASSFSVLGFLGFLAEGLWFEAASG